MPIAAIAPTDRNRADFLRVDPKVQDAVQVFNIPRDHLRPDAIGKWEVYWRRADAYGQLFPRPTAAEAAQFYDLNNYYTHSTGTVAPEAKQTLFWKVLRHLAWRRDYSVHLTDTWWQALLGDAPKRIIEIGCGNGDRLHTLKRLGHDVVGIEPDPKAVIVSAARGLKVYEGTAESVPVECNGQPFDMVIMLHVLEHTVDPELALEHARSLLGQNGLLVVEVPNNDCDGARRYGAIWNWLDAPRHLNFFTPHSLSNALIATGFDIERVEPYGYFRQFTPEWALSQQRIATAYGLRGPRPAAYLAQLAATCFAPMSRKYDSVRMVARPRNGETTT